MDLHNENNHQPGIAFGSALAELAHVVKVCLEHDVQAIEAIKAVEQCAAMGAVKYPVRWLALDPRIHFFPTVETAIANALLSVPEQLQQVYAADEIKFKDLVCAVSKHISNDGIFFVYAVVIGLNEAFVHATVGHAVSAGIKDREEGEEDYGF